MVLPPHLSRLHILASDNGSPWEQRWNIADKEVRLNRTCRLAREVVSCWFDHSCACTQGLYTTKITIKAMFTEIGKAHPYLCQKDKGHTLPLPSQCSHQVSILLCRMWISQPSVHAAMRWCLLSLVYNHFRFTNFKALWALNLLRWLFFIRSM